MFANSSLRVLGIDPGLTRCGYGVVDSASPKPRAIAAGVLHTSRELALPDRLCALMSDFEELMRDFQPTVVAVENVFFQSNVRTAMSVGQASGLALAVARRIGIAVVQYTPNEVKQSVTGNGNADKTQVQRMVTTLLSLSETPKPPDAADALALALTHLNVASFDRSVESANKLAANNLATNNLVGTK